jgi:DNA polymerase-4/DNA polymerase V
LKRSSKENEQLNDHSPAQAAPPAPAGEALRLRVDGFPTAILHFDGDAFFAAVEQAQDPALRGRPVVTGKERGIIACASYEAKACGISRNLSLYEARRRCPGLVVLPSDYETYSIFSQRMFAIARRYTPMVEEYSIDEGFADLTGTRRLHRKSYEDIARDIQTTIHAELGITVSVGLSLTKTLAKLASDFRKPHGFTAVAGCHLHHLLMRRKLEDVCGFGPGTSALLRKQGLDTPLDYARRSEKWAETLLGKIGRELWHELRGNVAYPVRTTSEPPKTSIGKCQTFAAASQDVDYVQARLMRCLESAFIKLRRHSLRTKVLYVGLRRQDYTQLGLEAVLSRPTSATLEAVPFARALFARLVESGTSYRATLVVLAGLESDAERQMELFEDNVRIEEMRAASMAADAVNDLYGKHTVCLGSVLHLTPQRESVDRDEQPWRKLHLLPGESVRRRLALPLLRMRV